MKPHSRIRRRKFNRFVKKFVKYALLGAVLGLSVFYFTLAGKEEDNKASISVKKNSAEKPEGKKADLLEDLFNADYALALVHLDREKDLHPDLWKMVYDSLSVQFNFTYLPQHSKNKTIFDVNSVKLNSDEPYHMLYTFSEESFVYLFQQNSDGDFVCLFPEEKYSSNRNPVQTNLLRIPEGIHWLYLNGEPGAVSIYLIASRWQQKKLGNIISLLSDNESHLNAQESLEYYLEKTSLSAAEIPGLVFSEYHFEHIKNTIQ